MLNAELQRLDPDLVAFQEVIHTPERHQLDNLIAGTSLQVTHQAQAMAYQPPWADRYGGTAVATRWPHQVVDVLDHRLHDAADVPWCTLAVAVELPGEGEVLFIATTASWRLDAESARERQAVAVTELDARHRRALPTTIIAVIAANGALAASWRLLWPLTKPSSGPAETAARSQPSRRSHARQPR
jgi:endonuclease/exonuclease/phosphatase family metal-dependent hydrolase